MVKCNYDWNFVDPYLDVDICNGSTGRTKIFLTLREFKDNIKRGVSLKEMQEAGVSKHLLSFLSKFSQGKIKLNKEEFEKWYFGGKELDEIASWFNIERGNLSYLRQLYGIDRKGANFIKRKKTEVPLTDRQKEILYGSMMGDAKRQDSFRGTSAGFVHSEGQKDYLMWKHDEFKNVVSKKALKRYEYVDERSGNTLVSWRFYTKANSDVEECLSKFYKNGDKQITRDILDNLTPLSVAVWYMDDGQTDKREREIRKYPDRNYSPMYKFCTDSFTLESCELIVRWFDERYGIRTRLVKNGENKEGVMKYRVAVNNESVKDFQDLIRPHIISSMEYKL